LEWLSLWGNKITHINPNVFDNLFKFKTLYLNSNPCIDAFAINNSTAVQNIIKTAQAQCTNLEYSNLEQKVKYLEKQSESLDSGALNEKLDNLESEVKDSKFPNFFNDQLQGINAILLEKETISKINYANNKLADQDVKVSAIERDMARINNAIDLINNNYNDLNIKFTNLLNALNNAFSGSGGTTSQYPTTFMPNTGSGGTYFSSTTPSPA
jgi:alanyl-tRNA synthetase